MAVAMLLLFYVDKIACAMIRQHASNFAKLFGIIVLFRSICGKALKKGGKGCIL
jgi:hypothetical protein